jgi:hypothetical protein
MYLSSIFFFFYAPEKKKLFIEMFHDMNCHNPFLGYSPNLFFFSSKKIKNIFELKTKKNPKNNSDEKRMSKRPENG